MKRILATILSMGFILTGCSDLNDGKGQNPDKVIEELNRTNCTVDTDNLANILSDPIPADINCIYDQLTVLMDLVRSERPELGGKNITRRTLENFIRKYVPNAVEALEYFDIFFTLNAFIFGTDQDVLLQEDFRRLKDFLLMVNREVSAIYVHLEKLDDDDRIGIKFHLNIKEQKILKAFRVIVKDARTSTGENISLLGLLEIRPNQTRNLDLLDLFDLFENDDNGNSIDEIQNLVFLKRILLGGSKTILTYREFIGFVRNNLEEFVDSFYDIYRHKHLSFDNEAKRFDLYGTNLERIRNLVFSENPSESLVDFTDLLSALNFYREDLLGEYSELDITELLPEIIRIKEILIGNEGLEAFSADDFFAILDEAQKVVNRSLKNSIFFEDNKNYLLSHTGRIKNGNELVNRYDPSDEDWASFVNTIVKYRYFKGDEPIPFFGNEIKRDIKTINLIGGIDFVVDKLFRFYEKEYPCHSSQEFDVYNFKKTSIHKDHRCNTSDSSRREDYNSNLNSGQLVFIVQEFRKVLYETQIITKTREDKAGENAASIPDLFLDSANDNGLLEREEFIEFLLSLFDSISIRKKVTPFVAGKCGVFDDTAEFGGPRYDVKCVRDHFYETFTEKFQEDDKEFNYFSHFPKFRSRYNEWKQSPNEDFLRKYLLLLEKFTKVCNYDNIPYTQADVMGLYTSVFSVESTFGKFDLNNDNTIDKKESKKAYAHFKRGLKSILKAEGGSAFGWLLSGFSKQFFKFLVDKKRLPFKVSGFFKNFGDAIDLLVTYNLKPFTPISREKIITVLTTLAETGEAKRKKRLGNAYESKEQYCGRVNHVTELDRKEWSCYVDRNQAACDIVKP